MVGLSSQWTQKATTPTVFQHHSTCFHDRRLSRSLWCPRRLHHKLDSDASHFYLECIFLCICCSDVIMINYDAFVLWTNKEANLKNLFCYHMTKATQLRNLFRYNITKTTQLKNLFGYNITKATQLKNLFGYNITKVTHLKRFAKFYSSTTFCSSHGRHTCVADKKKGGCFDGCYPSAEILTTRPTPALSHAHAYSLGMP